MAINKIIETTDFYGKKNYYKILDVKESNEESNGSNFYIIRLAETNKEGTHITKESEIKIKTNYQFFYDHEDQSFWGFDPFSHVHCYLEECPLRIEIIDNNALIKKDKFKDCLEKYLMELEEKENKKYLE